MSWGLRVQGCGGFGCFELKGFENAGTTSTVILLRNWCQQGHIYAGSYKLLEGFGFDDLGSRV